MNPSLSETSSLPNRPLRKPSSSPGPNLSILSQRLTTMPCAPLRPSSGGCGNGLCPSVLTINLCNYCGQQGSFRCKRCKKVLYCSVVCQTEDWKAHRHICQPFDPEPAKEKPKESTCFSAVGDKANQADLMPRESSSCKRLFLQDLQVTKIVEGMEIQASVIELHSPGRFFLLAQTPEMLKTLQSIGTELKRSCSNLPGTPYVPCVGEICAAQFSCDMNWYRALVQTLAADQKMANVLYIDFGNEERVPVDRLRPLPANIQPFCPCAMECRIAGVVPVFKDWSGECCMTMKRLLEGKTFTVKFLGRLENSRVHAVDILLSVGKQLSSFLIDEGYAQKETSCTAPTEQDISAMLNASFQNFKCLSDGKDDNKWAQPPEPLHQSIGDQFFVVVSHFQSPNDLVVQKVENAGLIQELQVKLRDHCSQAMTPQNFRPAPGTVCCAQFSEDKQWYRAKVLAYPSEEHVCVGYLDFGNSEKVDLNQLRPISPSLLPLPMQAIPCGLAFIVSAEQKIVNVVQPVGASWSKENLFALQRLVFNRILRIEILAAHEGKFLVAMFDESSDRPDNIAEQLISAGYASPAPVPPNSCLKAEESSAVAEQSASPHVSEPLVWSTAVLPADGQTVALVTSVVESPGKFYCHLSSPTDHQKLKELAALLKQHCETNASPFEPRVGEPCCAIFPGDGGWYRAMVKDISKDRVVVNYVDLGNDMTVEKSHLRSIIPKLLTLPFQAVCCWLPGVEPLGSEWSSEALLCFQTLVEGEQITGRVLSFTEQGYGVELQSRGQNVAAALIAEQLAKAPEGSVVKTSCVTEQQEAVKKNDVQANTQTQASSKETSEKQTSESSEVTCFPVDWKTIELPLNETFQPYVAAVVSPSLFYVLGSSHVDQHKLQEVMMELAAYCSNKVPSAAVQSELAPEAACCAQFTADNNWYRAVVLEVGQNEISVIYADYGNTETVPFSRILPVPAHLMQLPFLIARCTLTGKEHFPADWPEEVLQVFRTELANGVLATVQSFDGSANVLSLTLPIERGGGQLHAIILDALSSRNYPHPSTCPKSDKTCTNTSVSASAAPDCNQPKSLPQSQNEQEERSWPGDATGQTKTPKPATQSPSAAAVSEEPVKKSVDQMEPLCQKNADVTDPPTSSCCCLSLKKEIDKLQQLMELQLTLIKQFMERENTIHN